MEYKIVISDPETGKSYQREVKEEKAKRLKGLKIGAEFDGSVVDLTDYKLVVTGGSDKSGFPMKKGVHGEKREMVLSKGGVGYNPSRDERVRKRVRGQVIGEEVAQVNAKIVKKGKVSLEEVFGKKEDGKEGEGEKKPAEEKPPEGAPEGASQGAEEKKE